MKENCRIRLFVWLFNFAHFLTHISTRSQVPRHKSKKGGIKKRVYFWGGISWRGKTPGVAWTAADNKVIYRHTQNLCVGTVFEDVDDDTGNMVVFRVTETRAGGRDSYVWYVPHFDYPDEDPPKTNAAGDYIWERSSYREVKE